MSQLYCSLLFNTWYTVSRCLHILILGLYPKGSMLIVCLLICCDWFSPFLAKFLHIVAALVDPEFTQYDQRNQGLCDWQAAKNSFRLRSYLKITAMP